MKLLKKIIILLGICALAYSVYDVYQNRYKFSDLVHYNEAEKIYAQTKDQRKFEKYKEHLQDYYTSGAYENDIRKISQGAEKCFSAIPVTDDSIIIFDVDDTALYNWHFKGDFIWNQPKFSKMKQQKFKPAIEPILKLYNYLLNRGFKIIFITSRSDNDYQNTRHELSHAGYSNFYKLILMPTKLAFDPSIKTAAWKLDVRKELAQKYNIVGSVGDRMADFVGGYTGYIVKIPNYLY